MDVYSSRVVCFTEQRWCLWSSFKRSGNGNEKQENELGHATNKLKSNNVIIRVWYTW